MGAVDKQRSFFMACRGFVELSVRRLLVVPWHVGEPSGVAAPQGSDRWAGRGTLPASDTARLPKAEIVLGCSKTVGGRKASCPLPELKQNWRPGSWWLARAGGGLRGRAASSGAGACVCIAGSLVVFPI